MHKQDSRECDENILSADLPLPTEQAEQTSAGSGDVNLIGPPAKDGLKKIGLATLVLPNSNVG